MSYFGRGKCIQIGLADDVYLKGLLAAIVEVYGSSEVYEHVQKAGGVTGQSDDLRKDSGKANLGLGSLAA